MRVFFSAGEPSGDQHGAHLIRELRRRYPDIECCGFGGPLMQQSGCRLLFRLTDLAVMGILRVVPLLARFRRLVKQAEQSFRESPPDAVVLIDFPGFNWWIARRAKAAGILVIYYLPPQLWAWAPWRVRRMRRLIDHVLSGLSFERDWLAARGVAAEFTGHPFFDEVAQHPLDMTTVDRYRTAGQRVLGVLPGSRGHEVERNWPVMLDVLDRLHRQHPDVLLPVACYSDEHRRMCRRILSERSGRLPLEFIVGRTPEVIEAADCCLMVSGSVSLELLARTTPGVVLYRIGRVLHWFSRACMTCEYITLPNLMVGDALMPEFLSSGNPARDVDDMFRVLDGWIANPVALQTRVARLTKLRTAVGATGATSRAARSILSRLSMLPTRRAA